MNILYKFCWDCGRQGIVEGLFIADSDVVAAAIGETVYFGEILGKHSEISGKLEEKDLTIVSTDADKLEWLEKIIGSEDISGYNPLNYLLEDPEDEDLEEEDEEEA